jgi:ABC-type amino acid transport system permease subunit
VIAGAIVYVLFKVAKELWDAGEKILAGFASLLVVFVKTLPMMILAGLIAVGGLWIVRNVDLDRVVAAVPQSLR